MVLLPGARLGPYEIEAAIGAGGMGEVYRARDTRLGRIVAIKVLPAGAAADPERRRRFEQEARAASALNHPHICVLYDIGSEGGTDFLVMEYLDGQTLAERLTKGPLPLEQAIEVGVQIAEALDKAHRQGILHRDLKPGNVMLTKTGAARQGSPQAKLLDFGLAKLKPPGPGSAELSSCPTEEPATAQGTILGTVPYMAPEQLEGKAVDARTDLFAFGAILYEMVTGRRAFEGASTAAVISAIMSSEPAPVSSLQPMTPPALDRLIKRSLAKDPDQRWDSGHDVADELRWIGETPVQTAPPATRAGGRWRTRLLLVAAAATAVVALLDTGLWLTRTGTAPGPPVHLMLSEQRPAKPVDPQRSLAISRDGRTVVFTAERDGVRRLYVRRMESPESAVVAGTDDAAGPFFSPDGERVGFFAAGQLKIVSIGGGASATLAPASAPRGGTWTRDDTIIFTPEPDAGLWQVPAAGGTATFLARPDAGKRERSYRWPEILPDDDTLVFTVAMTDILSFDEARLMKRSRRTGEQSELLRGGSFSMYAETGHLIYARAGTIMAVPFDAGRGAITGVPFTAMRGVVTYPINGSAQYAVSRTGTLAFVPGGSTIREARLDWVDRSGKAERLNVPPAAYMAARISPDGRVAALDVDNANASVSILDLERAATPTRLTLQGDNGGAVWSPDGSRVAFYATEAGRRKVFVQAVDGRSGPEPLTPSSSGSPSTFTRSSWSPDSPVLAYDRLDPETGWDIWTVATREGAEPRPFLKSSFNERDPAFSPDGRWIAYDSDETGRPEIYVQPYPGPGGKSPVSRDGGTFPVWARDGRELFYRGLDGASLMSVALGPSPARSPGQPRLLFRRQSSYPFDVGRDGRFLMIEDQPEQPLSPITVVLNWFDVLKAHVPARKQE